MHYRELLTTIAACLFILATSHAQPSSNAESATPNQIVILKASRNVLEIDKDIKRVDLDLRSIAPGQLLGQQVVMAIKQITFFNGQEVSQSMLSDARSYLEIESTELATILTQFQPLRIERVFQPPFDTIYVKSSGERVNLPDLSLNYRVILRNSQQREAFIAALKNLEGVLAVHREHTAADFEDRADIFPPKDPRYSDQWYLKPRSTEPYSADLERAWYLSGDNDEVKISIIEAGGANIIFIQHVDLDDNIYYQFPEG